MNPNQNTAGGSGVRLEDIYYVIFRYKWIIILFSLAGLITAAVMWFASTPVYESEAKLLVRYVLDDLSMTPTDGVQVKTPDARGDTIIASELEILTSLDLAIQVAAQVGPEKILSKGSSSTNVIAAAAKIRSGITVEVPRRSSIIRVVFQHTDQSIVMPVLRSIIDSYREKHVAIHRGVGILDEVLNRQTADLRLRLTDTEDALREAKAKAGVISLEDTRRALIEEKSRIRMELLAAEAELAEYTASMKLEKPGGSQAETNSVTDGLALEPVNDYKALCAQLNTLNTQRRELLGKYTEEHLQVQRIKDQIAQVEKEKTAMEAKEPRLKALGGAAGSSNSPDQMVVAVQRTTALEAKISTLQSQLKRVQKEAVELEAAESSILQLQRKKELDEQNYRHYFSNLEKAKLDDALGAGKVTNINEVQSPSPAVPSVQRLMRYCLVAVGSGVGLGLGIAFLLGLYLDQCIRRAKELETRLHIPLFLSIPEMSGNGKPPAGLMGRVRGWFGKQRKPVPTGEAGAAAEENSLMKMTPAHSENHVMRGYFDALRDRLITFFEVRNMTHKPKLVAVTSPQSGAGVTMLAAGLAAAMSETGEGKVLLVDMTQGEGSAHPFYRGQPGVPLPELLDSQKRDDAMVRENLFLATASNPHDKLPAVLPKRFSHLVPKMKASDYDYIIFDMPPISATSITPRLASFMDMVVLVVEAETTNREVVRNASEMLSASGANVSAVFNKQRKYLPKQLHHEL